MPNVLSPRDLVFRHDNMDETVPHTYHLMEVFEKCIHPLVRWYDMYAEEEIRCVFDDN